MFSKHAGERCGGVQLVITDRISFDSVSFGLHLLAMLHELGGDQFMWLPPQEDRYFIDLLCGTDTVGHAIDSNGAVEDLLAGWREDARAFENRRSDILLYE